jgi:hypothetical protein
MNVLISVLALFLAVFLIAEGSEAMCKFKSRNDTFVTFYSSFISNDYLLDYLLQRETKWLVPLPLLYIYFVLAPPIEIASPPLTPCERASRMAKMSRMLGAFIPKCESDGSYAKVQCHGSTGHCWCVDESGKERSGTRVRGTPDCSGMSKEGKKVHV